jgi:peptidoglycan/xylan/chitin deacetylase (PgdA/CDA1 family)
MFYFIKSPFWLQWLYKECVWEIKNAKNSVFLSFDDGPHPEITPFVFDNLKEFGAKASFFCIGKNVEQYPEIYQRIIDEGHTVGNHTFQHKNGWKTPLNNYIEDIQRASTSISSRLFRPPYGKITRKQILFIKKELHLQPIMWTVLSGDFDKKCSAEQTYRNVVEKISPGSIVVFHDSLKCGEKLKYALPLVLKFIQQKKWLAEKIDVLALL